jgi:hypothetical protein
VCRGTVWTNIYCQKLGLEKVEHGETSDIKLNFDYNSSSFLTVIKNRSVQSHLTNRSMLQNLIDILKCDIFSLICQDITRFL